MEIIRPVGGRGTGVLVAHPWWGLNQTIREYGAAFAGAGFVVGLADVFDGKIATTVEEAEALAQSYWPVAAERLAAAHDELVAATGGPVSAVGFSFGAFHLMRLLEQSGLPLTALVIYYATGTLPAGHPPVLAHLAEDDPHESYADMAALTAALVAAGPPNAAYTYTGATHWFAEADRPEFNAAAAELAFDRTVAFITATAK